jgi:hypothetical protein
MFSYRRLKRYHSNINPQAPSTMANLPPEVLSHIISFVSDRCTLRSLSLVSRTTSALTLPFLYRFITISGTTQLVDFLKVVQRIPARLALIRSIFLCDASAAPEKRGNLKLLRRSGEFLEGHLRGQEYLWRKPLRELEAFLQPLALLLPLVAPFLETMTCIFTSNIVAGILQTILTPSYSSLIRLTLKIRRYAYYSVDLTISAPSLKYLHLSSSLFYFCAPGLTTIAKVCDQCEVLETLVLSGPMPLHSQFVQLHSNGFHNPDIQVRPIAPLLSETIRRVVIKPHTWCLASPQWQRNQNLDERRRFVTLDMEPVLAWVHPVDAPTCEEWLQYTQEEHGTAQAESSAIRLIYTPGTPRPEALPLAFHDIPYAYSYLHTPSIFGLK